MPLAASTCLAIALSIASAEPSTPAPDVGHVGQLEQALHRAVLAHRAVQQRQHDGALAGLVGWRQHGVGRHRACRPDRGLDGSARRPGGAAPAGAVGQRPLAVAGDADRRDPVASPGRRPPSTWAAVTQLTSCSADCPPNSTTRWIRSEAMAANGTVRRGEDPGIRRGRRHRRHARGPDVDVDGASFDSRSLRPGQLFVPLVAERDGHEFVAAAVAAGAAATLASPPGRRRRSPSVEVADTAAALMALATWARDRLAGDGRRGHRQRRQDEHQGPRAGRRRRRPAGRGERAQLQQRAGPAGDDPRRARRHRGPRAGDGDARLRGDRPAVRRRPARHRCRHGGRRRRTPSASAASTAWPGPRPSSSRRCRPTGTAVLNADDERVRGDGRRAPTPRVLTFGPIARRRRPDQRRSTLDDLARPRFVVAHAVGDAPVELAVSGAPHGDRTPPPRSPSPASSASTSTPPPPRWPRRRSRRCGCRCSPRRAGGLVINDAYNANPTSMVAALDALAAVDADRRVAVLGGMAELDDPAAGHRAVAARAARPRRRARRRRHRPLRRRRRSTPPTSPPSIGPIGAGIAVLVKASRAFGLERSRRSTSPRR